MTKAENSREVRGKGLEAGIWDSEVGWRQGSEKAHILDFLSHSHIICLICEVLFYFSTCFSIGTMKISRAKNKSSRSLGLKWL